MLFFHSATYSQVSIDSLIRYALFLSAPDKKGRLPGTPQYDICAEYIIEHFQRHRIKPLPEYPDFKQHLTIPLNVFQDACDFHFILPDGSKKHFIQGVHYSFRGFTGSGAGTYEAVFCGFGITNTHYDDYRDVDVKGKAVIIFKDNPPFSEKLEIPPFSVRERALNAYKHGAAAVIFVYPPVASRNRPIASVQCSQGQYIPDLPMLEMDSVLFEMLLKEHQLSVKEVYEYITILEKPLPLSFQTKMHIHVRTFYTANAHTYNIIGYIQGTDKELRKQFILLSAHLDHVGSQCDVIYPGANDNASGVAALMELARVISEKPLQRSVLFVFFTGEEAGLVGSKFFASNLPLQNEQIVAVLNFDCIAVGDSIQIGNGLSAPQLYELCKKNDTERLIVKQTWKGGGADLTPLHEIGIPGLYLVSKYSYPHLHLPTDKVETFNTKLFLAIVDLAYKTIRNIDELHYTREKIF